MKTLLISIILLLLAGCLSPNKSSYQPLDGGQFTAKIMRNEKSRDYVWNHWRYAGSDENYDYVYEYTPGSVIPYGFKCYRLPKGVVDPSVRYDFDPDFGNNMRVF